MGNDPFSAGKGFSTYDYPGKIDVHAKMFKGIDSYFCMIYTYINYIKQGAKLQQARLIGASDAVNRRRGALAPAGVGGGF